MGKICFETKLLLFLLIIAGGATLVFKDKLKTIVNPPTQCSS